MQCFHPFVAKTKGVPIYGASGILLGYQSRYQTVPCGKCLACLKARRQSWAFRIEVETEQYPDASFFVSLTYNDESLPYGENHATLCKKDLTEFFHKLRSFLAARDSDPPSKRPAGRKYFRYFACGEYGDSFGRPHYHFAFWDLFFKYPMDKWLKIFQQVWKFCDPQSVDIEEMSPARAEYLAKYCLKQAGIDYEAKGVESPFSVMSRRPGIGEAFMNSLNIERLRSSGGLQVFDSTGCKFTLPRYYRNSGKFYSEDELRAISDSYQSFVDRLEAVKMKQDPYYFHRYRSVLMAEYNILRKMREDSFGKDFI